MEGAFWALPTLLTFSLLISEDFLVFFLDFPAIAVFSAHLSEGIKRLRSLRKERKGQKSSQISKEKANKVLQGNPFLADWCLMLQMS